MKNKLKCRQCGFCCKATMVNGELPDEVKELWYEISFEEAREHHGFNMLFVRNPNIKFYNCKALKNNRCSIHEKRPDICREYPRHGYSIKHSKCGFFDPANENDFQVALVAGVMKKLKNVDASEWLETLKTL